jgi:hypothetical protein
MSDEHYEQEVTAHEETKAERDSMIVAVRGVIACFKSRTRSSICSEDHHPSCQQYLEHVLKKVTGGL